MCHHYINIITQHENTNTWKSSDLFSKLSRSAANPDQGLAIFMFSSKALLGMFSQPVKGFPVSTLSASSRFSLSASARSTLFRRGLASEAPKTKTRLTREQYAKLVEMARHERQRKSSHTTFYYSASVVVLFLTLSYAAVPFYRIVCQNSGLTGTPMSDSSKFTPDKLIPVEHHKRIRVSFSSNTSTSMPWKFTPQQREVRILPGETALAFYKAKNPTDQDIIGMATYSVVPEKAAIYFSKIQCFCFEEQRLGAGEEVDMPVFFFIDPDFVNDPQMRNVDDIILNYTFFKARYDDNGVLIPVTGAEAIDYSIMKNPIKTAPVAE